MKTCCKKRYACARTLLLWEENVRKTIEHKNREQVANVRNGNGNKDLKQR